MTVLELTQEEFDQRYTEYDYLDDVTCNDQCPHFDSLNECCWATWWHKWYGDYCDLGYQEDEDGNWIRIIVREEGS